MTGNRRLDPVERVLRLFTDVRGGEGPTALLLMLNIFLIFVAYAILKVLRESLVLTAGGVDAKAISAAGQAILLLGAVPLYGAFASRVPRRRLINVVTVFFVGCIAAFYALRTAGVSVGIVFYIWLGIFNVMLIAQFWGFANDIYTMDEGKRLFPLVAFGGTSGAVVGAWTPSVLRELVGTDQLLLVAAGLLLASVVITNVVDERERRRTEVDVPDVNSTGTVPAATGQFRAASGVFKVPSAEYRRESGTFAKVTEDEESATAAPPESTGGAFQLVLRNRYLLLMGALVLLLNWVNTSGENILAAFVNDATRRAVESGAAAGMTAEDLYTTFYSRYQGLVNIVTMLLQLFVVSRVIKYLGVGAAILVLPIVAFAGYAAMVFVPILGVVRWAKTSENATDYSLNNTARNALFLPTTREEKYKAKQVVDSLGQRTGDVLAAVTWFGGTKALGLSFAQLAVVNLALVAVWIVVAVAVGRRYRRLAAVAEG